MTSVTSLPEGTSPKQSSFVRPLLTFVENHLNMTPTELPNSWFHGRGRHCNAFIGENKGEIEGTRNLNESDREDAMGVINREGKEKLGLGKQIEK